jgi:hypothetical protein
MTTHPENTIVGKAVDIVSSAGMYLGFGLVRDLHLHHPARYNHFLPLFLRHPTFAYNTIPIMYFNQLIIRISLYTFSSLITYSLDVGKAFTHRSLLPILVLNHSFRLI